MTRNMEGKVALVTGATGGLGQALARRFAQAGAAVAINDRREQALKALVDELTSEGHSAFGVAGDIASAEQAWDVVARAIEHFGRLDYANAERFYIGRRHVTDEVGDPLVVDWRAPISRPFYRASRGEPLGVRLRRRFGFQHGTLPAYEDEPLGSAGS